MPEPTSPVTTSPFFALIRLMRPWNVLMIVAAMWVFFVPLMGVSPAAYGWAVLAMAAAAAAGNVINDYFDVREDRVNKPRRALVGRVVKRRVALASHHVLSGIALVAAGYGAWQLQVRWPLMYMVVLGGALAAYSPFFKRSFLRGNLLIAFAVGQLPLWAGGVVGTEDEGVWKVLTGYAALSFWLTLVREITKDLQDAAGDAQWGYDTLAVRWERTRTVRLLHGLLAVGALGLGFAATWWWGQIGLPASWCSAFLLPYFAGWLTLRNGEVTRLSAWLKLSLAGGLVALAAASPLA
jgi:4-hydroxybenzoate polyprenyltransferase